ncbi:hypothetical protein V1478_002529 [Vespula squamosa]|uniref:Uncharacterized protein n=1 Tax=Vespula squamosa TaxID=30214 RepID=A0ABD2BSU2_VESSQ
MVFGGVTEFYNSTSGQATPCMGRARQLERVDDRVPTHKMGFMYSREQASERAKAVNPETRLGPMRHVSSFTGQRTQLSLRQPRLSLATALPRAHPVKPIDPTPYDLPRSGSFLSYHKT